MEIKKFNDFIAENLNISDFKNIEDVFMKIYYMITKQPFNNKIVILPETKIYKKTGKSSAVMRRKIFFGKNKIWIREMPDYQMIYELSHEIGHTLKPHLENEILAAEEIKAILFQCCFMHAYKMSGIEIKHLEDFVEYRKSHIKRADPTYAKYQEIAEKISIQSNYNFDRGVKIIQSHL